MKRKIVENPPDTKSFSFPSSDAALKAYKQACAIVENKFFMHHETLVSISDNVVTVPIWFPYSGHKSQTTSPPTNK